MEENFYDILGVSPRATDEEISRAYRQLAMQNHPDRGGDAAVMTDLNRAYEILGDPEQRAMYDEYLGLAPEGSFDHTRPAEPAEAQMPREEPSGGYTALRVVLRLADALAEWFWRLMASDSIPWLLGYGLILLVVASVVQSVFSRLRLP